MKTAALGLLALLTLCHSAAAVADIIIVRPDGTGDFPTIQAAVDAATDGDIIELTNGTFSGSGNRDIVFLGKALHIRSQSGQPELCLIDCGGSDADLHRGFLFENAEGRDSVIEGITVMNGYADKGGAVRCSFGVSPTITQCILTDNVAQFSGGAIYSEGSGLALSHSIIANNVAASSVGGGVDFDDSTHPELRSQSPAAAGPATSVDHCTFYGNAAEHGGGMDFEAGGIPISNTIIAFSVRGGGVSCESGTEATFTCCDIFGNAGGDLICGIDGGSNISLDPLFCDPGNGDLSLQESSPCAPAGSPPGCGLIGARAEGCGGLDCSRAVASQSEIWPPNNQFTRVDVLGVTDPSGEPVTITIDGVTQDEPLVGPGYGNRSPDARRVGDGVELRAERGGAGDGRVYVISFTATSGGGGTCSGTVSVCVPHSHSPHQECVDSGQSEDSFGLGSRRNGDEKEIGDGQPVLSAAVSSGMVVVDYGLDSDSGVDISVFDVTGRLVAVLMRSHQTRGVHRLSWDGSPTARGVYYVRIETAGRALTRRIVLTR